jgi:ferredoxin-NADP reductase
MLAKKYKSEVVSILNPFEGIYTVEIRSLGNRYRYHPGQFLHLALDSEYDGAGQWPESRCFSMQSNPEEENIRITYAVKGVFTREMEKYLRPGSEIWLKLPYGDLFQQSHSKEKTVFIAGGTGITPFLSLFTSVSFNEYVDYKIYLGFRNRMYNIYHKELVDINQDKLKIFYQETDGVIDIDQIFNINGRDCCYFISGPPQMIKTFRTILAEKGVERANILTDDWE